MSTGYRQNARSRDDVLLGERKGIALWHVALVIAIGVAVVTTLSHRVRFDCERATNTCTITDRRLAWSRHSTLPLDSLRRADAEEVDGVVRVTLTTTTGEVQLSDTGETGGENEKQAVAGDITAFVHSGAPSLHVGYGSLSSAWPFGLLAIVLLALGRPLFRVRVLAEPSGSLRVERSVLGIWSRARHYELGGVRAVKVVSELPKEVDGPGFFTSSDNWFVILERTGGAVLLDDWYTSRLAPSEALGAALRAHLSTLG